MTKRKLYLVICEGKTEFNYIQKLNRFLRDNSVNNSINFVPQNLNGLSVSNYVQKITKEIKSRVKSETCHYCFVWIDIDIFKRGDMSAEKVRQEIISKIKLPKKSKIQLHESKILFNYMNGEDFFIMHEGEEIVQKWQKVCEKNGNYLKGNSCFQDLKSEFNNILGATYKKGDTPEIHEETLQTCLDNIKNNEVCFKSDAKLIIELVLNQIKEKEVKA